MICLLTCIGFHLQKPIVPADLYRAVRDSQLVGMSGYTKQVFQLLIQQFFPLGLYLNCKCMSGCLRGLWYSRSQNLQT